MKFKIISLITAALTFFAYACTNEASDGEIFIKPQSITVNATLEQTKTLIGSGGESSWYVEDFLFAFNTDGLKFVSGVSPKDSEDNVLGIFTFENWAGNPEYIVFNPRPTAAYPTDGSDPNPDVQITDGSITAVVVDEQKIGKVGSSCHYADVAVGRVVTDDQGVYSAQMEGLCGFVSCEVGAGVARIELVSDKNIAGKISVNYNEGEPLVSVVEGKTKVTIINDNYSLPAGTFHFCVLPEVLDIVTINVLDADNEVLLTKTIEEPMTVTRGKVSDLGYIYPEAVEEPESDFTLVVTIADFAEIENFPISGANSKKEKTKYTLTIGGVAYDFYLYGGPAAEENNNGFCYSNSNKGVQLGRANGYIQLPKIEGKVLSSVTITSSNNKCYGLTCEPNTTDANEPTYCDVTGARTYITKGSSATLEVNTPDASNDYYLIGAGTSNADSSVSASNGNGCVITGEMKLVYKTIK